MKSNIDISAEISTNGNSFSADVKSKDKYTADISLNGVVKQLIFGNYFEFPAIGVENMLYVAKDTHKTYLFDAEKLVYQVVGSDYEEIEIIQSTL